MANNHQHVLEPILIHENTDQLMATDSQCLWEANIRAYFASLRAFSCNNCQIIPLSVSEVSDATALFSHLEILDE